MLMMRNICVRRTCTNTIKIIRSAFFILELLVFVSWKNEIPFASVGLGEKITKAAYAARFICV